MIADTCIASLVQWLQEAIWSLRGWFPGPCAGLQHPCCSGAESILHEMAVIREMLIFALCSFVQSRLPRTWRLALHRFTVSSGAAAGKLCLSLSRL